MNPCDTCTASAACTQLFRHPNQPVQTDFAVTDGVFIKHIAIPEADMLVPQHSHAYDHTTFVSKGRVIVRRDDLDVPFEAVAPTALRIPAGVKHSFLSLEPTDLLCIHNVARSGAVEVREEHHIV
jgi:mannose-6-phosphate isomerase-like protein (cupin superfamily)